MAGTVYLESSIISYLAGRPSRDLITAARQQLTTAWWDGRRAGFQMYVSEVVLDEIRAGDDDAARRRTAIVEGVPVLRLTMEAVELARVLVNEQCMPKEAATDALHVGLAAANGIDYLLTWNCKHIANALTRGRIERVLRLHGHEPPVLCTPEELMGE
jgi:hypothetical protein